MSTHRTAALGTAAGLVLLPMAAQAHTGHDAHASLMLGLLHPLTGWDHLVVLLSLGALAAGRGTRVAAVCGAMLVAALGGGATLGLNWPAVPFIEPALIVTVLACITLLGMRRRISAAAVLGVCMAFAFVHGIAHGQEAPSGDLAGYFTGFTLAGLSLYAGGLVFMHLLVRAQKGAPITSRQPGKSPASR